MAPFSLAQHFAICQCSDFARRDPIYCVRGVGRGSPIHRGRRANSELCKSRYKEVYRHLVSIVYNAHHNVEVTFVTF